VVAKGLTVLAGSRNFERDQAAAKEIGPGDIALQLDVTDRVSIADAAERIRQEFGRLDQFRSERCYRIPGRAAFQNGCRAVGQN
jgi:NADP-dependent 3-hydroxy acid dehydrogenase YdfG